jgi:uncharacterized membrane protein SirB2
MIAALKHLHVTMAVLSILGFLLRGYWAWASPALLQRKPVKIVPHIIDTLLLAAAIGLLIGYGWNPFAFGWLTAKIVLLVAYIVLGTIALKGRVTGPPRAVAFFAAVIVFAWIAEIAVTRTVMPFA